MAKRPRIYFYLIHRETGQRYPVDAEVVIGRSAGDILFPEDAKLSGAHCRIVRDAKGVVVHDLESSNGTLLNETRLAPEKVYKFKPGWALTVGQQIFELRETKVSARMKRRPARPRKPAPTSPYFIGAVVLLLFTFLAYKITAKRTAPAPAIVDLDSPFEIVEKEMREVFREYTVVGLERSEKRMSDKEFSRIARESLLPGLTRVRAKMGVVRPNGEFERRKVEADERLLKILIAQVEAMTAFADTGNPKYSLEIERLGNEASAARDTLQKLDATRAPARN